MNSVRPETILVMKDLLRRYPERKTEVLPSLQRCLRRVDDEPEAQAALIWMAGEYGGEGFPETPYLLEPLIDGYAGLASAMVKLNLLTATMKLFFKRPPETQSMLGRLLAAATNDLTSQDVHDRALLYYRLLSTDIQAARRVVLGKEEEGGMQEGRAVVLGAFAEERDMTNLREKLFGEFNTLAVVYGKPSAQFVSPRYVPPSLPPLLFRNQFFSAFLFPSSSLFCSSNSMLNPITNFLPLPPSLPPSLPLPQLPMQACRDLPHPLPNGGPRRRERERGQQPPRPKRR